MSADGQLSKEETMYNIAVDIGGTHTDAAVMDDQGNVKGYKTASTPEDPSKGVLSCCTKAAKDLDIGLDQLLGQTEIFINSTTIASNTLIMESGAKVGTIITEGFRDVIEIRRGRRETGFNFMVEFPTMLSTRHLRVGVKERMNFKGEVLTPLNEADVLKAVAKFKKYGVESVAVTFLHSHVNPAHEKKAGEIVAREMPGIPISLSSDVLPLSGEFERFSTTTVDAYVAPQLQGYLSLLEKRLRDNGLKGKIFIAQCNGGVAAPEVARKRAIWSMGSGPCSGPLASLYYARNLNTGKIITTDTGGTSFDISLIVDNDYFVTTDTWINDQRMAVPMVDVSSKGAGGGSIAWINQAGVLQVGPKSAGAVPGPCCYGKGGQEPTLTDADLVLGYLDPDYFLGGETKLNVDLARKAIQDKVATPLGLSLVEAARSIVKISESIMANAVRDASTQKGHDPRDFTLIGAGGAGPVHGASVAQETEITQVLIPKGAGSFCAFGWLLSDVRHDFVRSRLMYLDKPEKAEVSTIETLYRDMLDEAHGFGLDVKKAVITRSIDMRYAGQFRTVEVDLPSNGTGLSVDDMAKMIKAFDEKHKKLFAFNMAGRAMELINFRTKVFVPLGKPELKKLALAGADASSALLGKRKCYFGNDFVETAIYDGEKLRPGNSIKGPAVIELVTTTVVIPPTFTCGVNEFGDYLLKYQA
jgi:N-methylhydantoinase A